jgi:hypothetical protein
MLVEFNKDKLQEYYIGVLKEIDRSDFTGDTDLSSLDFLKREPNALINELKNLLGDVQTLDYAHQIKEFKDQGTFTIPQQQRKCWILRLQILIKILIEISLELISNENEKLKLNPADYSLGFFGSNKPTSDIDIGIQYNALNNSNLSKLVEIIEDKFIYLGYRPLDFDIECYGDLLTITNVDNGIPIEYLYLSSSDFECEEFKLLLPYCGASVYRNYLHTGSDKAKFNTEFKEFINVIIPKLIAQNNNNNKKNDDIKKKNLIIALLRNCITNSLFHDKNEDVNTYMNPNVNTQLEKFNKQRTEYYKRVAAAEELLNNMPSNQNANLHFQKRKQIITDPAMKKDEIIRIINAIGDALIYREESYVCVPTIIHVVRIMQANAENAKAKMGVYGYLISILEQIGYLFRFKDNPTKTEKYMSRLTNALSNINIKENIEACISNTLEYNNVKKGGNAQKLIKKNKNTKKKIKIIAKLRKLKSKKINTA